MFIDHAAHGRSCVNGLCQYRSVYPLQSGNVKLALSYPSLSHNVWSISLAGEWDFVSQYFTMTSVWSRGLSHSHVYWKNTRSQKYRLLALNLSICHFQNSYIYIYIEWLTDLQHPIMFLSTFMVMSLIMQVSDETCTAVKLYNQVHYPLWFREVSSISFQILKEWT